MRVAILGGGGFRTPLLATALDAAELGVEDSVVDELVLHDLDPERLAVMAAVVRGVRARVTTTTDLDTALWGSDLIFAAMRVGGLDGRVGDERRALELGIIGQETVGAGGLAYALRTLPVVDAVARRIAELAPGAWTITMTNPAGLVTQVMGHHLGSRVIGVCDSPIGLIRRACVAAGLDPGTERAGVEDRIHPDYLGLNHLGWLRGLWVEGTDRLPALLDDAAALAGFEEGSLFGGDVVRALGAIPNEYLYWYYARQEALAGVLAAGRSRGEHVRTQQEAFYAAALADPDAAARLWAQANDERNRSYFAEVREGERDDQDVAAGGYETVAAALARALTGAAPARLVVNTRNGDTVAGLAPDAAIETLCRVDETGATADAVAAPTEHQLGLMCSVHSCETAIADAALTGSRDAALQAFVSHPLVGSLTAARALTDDAFPNG